MARILVADDRAASRELILSMLESAGHQGDEAENGAEVFVRLGINPPDLILLDLHMPLMDGFEVVHQIRATPEWSKLPVIALTASAMLGDRERALREGFTAYITKPVRLGELRSEINRLLNL
jgi:CheY-like chemotaxis protein